MKKIMALAALHSSLLFAGQTGGGGGLGKQLPSDLLLSLMTERLPSVNVDPDILRRAEARLSVEGVEAVDMPLDNAVVTVKRLHSAVVDMNITTRFVAD